MKKWESILHAILLTAMLLAGAFNLGVRHGQVMHQARNSYFGPNIFKYDDAEDWLNREYKNVNKDHFDGKLAPALVICSYRPNAFDDYAYTEVLKQEPMTFRITISQQLCDLGGKVVEPVLFHEMCHVSAWDYFDKHPMKPNQLRKVHIYGVDMLSYMTHQEYVHTGPFTKCIDRLQNEKALTWALN